jgi:hypothetical protein
MRDLHHIPKFKDMKRYILMVFIMTIAINAIGQNVGIGTNTPTEKLDVNGNINIAGTIKANGQDGQPNQVLMKNGSGALAWGDLSDFKNLATFLTSGNWNVPSGVTKIAVELWGAGGGGASVGGGGGGGYIMGVFSVTPGSNITFGVGVGGTGTSNGVSSGGDGTASKVTIGGVEIDAYGGSGAVYNSLGSYFASGQGGGYYADANFTAFYGMNGQSGTVTKKNYAQVGVSIFYEIVQMGDGGDGANSINTGGKGTYYISTPGNFPSFSDIRFTGGNTGKVPGGGGGSYFVNSFYGGNGMVVFHY